MQIKRMFIIVIVLAALLVPMSVQAKPPSPGRGGDEGPASCKLPEANAESLGLLRDDYPGYWWNHTGLTSAVQAAPNVDAKYLKVINEAIATWTEVLEKCFDGAITRTNVTIAHASQQTADIVLHYVPTAGGASF